MNPTDSQPKIMRFGPFEADITTQELRKNGNKLRLPNQSFLVLSVLLERPGQLVTRDDLRERLWPSDTFVEYDQGLNVVVNRLHEALGDSAEKPRYIETLPRRGYRFIGAIEPVSANGGFAARKRELFRARIPAALPFDSEGPERRNFAGFAHE